MFESILELGSGTGVLGMALYKFLLLRHNKNDNNQHQPIVALTDGDTKAVELLQQNLNHADNRIAMHLPHDHSGDDDDDDNDKKCECCCKATCLQWGVPESLSLFDDWCRESFASRTFGSVLGTTSQANDEEEAQTVSSLPPPPFVFDVIVAGKPKFAHETTKSCSCTTISWTFVCVCEYAHRRTRLLLCK
jgi:hypothetical protein